MPRGEPYGRPEGPMRAGRTSAGQEDLSAACGPIQQRGGLRRYVVSWGMRGGWDRDQLCVGDWRGAAAASGMRFKP